MKYFLILALCIPFLYADDILTIQTLKLYEEKTWLNLLHADKDGSIVKERSFFLSKHKNPTPKDEIFAAVNAYKVNDIHRICRFPARFFWLSKQLKWKNFNNTLKGCVSFNDWELLKNVKSISIIFVSSYLGNPASAFGHSFLKVNKHSKGNTNLSDISIGYGAKLPEEYGVISYLYNGIFGIYRGSYTHKYYFMDDLIYSNQEFREMWEYHLNLKDDKIKLLLMHLWELKKVTFGYYFFNRNCGFKMSELLEVVSEKKILDSGLLWYAPIETFLKLENITDKIMYYPSLQQKMYAFYEGFFSKEKNILKDIFLRHKSINSINKDIPVLSRIKILDFIIEFYAYQLMYIEKGSVAYDSIQKNKNIALRKRISLPIKEYKKNLPPVKPPITDYSKPRKIKLVTQVSDGEHRFLFGFTPFQVDSMGYTLHFGDSFSIFDAELTMSQSKLSFTKIDFLKIQRFNYEQLPFDVGTALSWKVHIGMDTMQERDYFAKVGLGYSRNYFDTYIVYGMVDFSVHTHNNTYRMYPHLGIFMGTDTFKWNIEYGKENSLTNSSLSDKLNIQLQYNVDNENSIFIEFKKEEEVELMNIGYKWYF